MRRITKNDDGQSQTRIPKDATSKAKLGEIQEPGVFVSDHGDETTSTCLNCPEKHCTAFGEEERPLGTTVEDVCPVDAISFNSDHTRMEIDESCFGCGLCVMRCPFDSIYLSDRPKLGSEEFSQYDGVTDERYRHFLDEFRRDLRSGGDKNETIDLLVERCSATTQSSFYPLVASMLNSLGLPTTLPPGGDTNNRIDALIYRDGSSAPVEIKSPTETREINVKSIQQAIENKIVLDERFSSRYRSSRDTSSLVVGYKYPNDRSDVQELIDDCYQSFNIRIGIIDLRSLYNLVWEKLVKREDVDESYLLNLKGVALA